MAIYERAFSADFVAVVNQLNNDICNNAVSMELVDESNYAIGDTRIAVRVYDKYFMRNGSRASLSVTVVGHGNDIFISAIGAGGGKGVFLNYSWGAEDELVSVVQESVERMGF